MKLAAYKNNQLISSYETPELSVDDSFEVFIGRSEDCHLQIDDPQVSREHAIILYENSKWTISRLTDVGTVIINGESVQEKALEEGESLHFGPFVIEVTSLDLSTVEEDISLEEDTPIVAEEETKIEEVAIPEEEVVAEEEAVDEFSEEEAEGTSDDSSAEDEESSQEDSNESEGEFGATEESEENFGEEGEFGAEPGSDDEGFGDEGGFDDESGTEDGGFGDDEGGVEESSGGGDSTIVFSNFASYELEIFGEHAPYDKFIIENDEVLIGRNSDKCQISLDDTEVSTIHAKLKKTKISLLLEDLNSTNGTILNGARVNKSELNNGDEFIIGSTTFTVHVRSEMLDEEEERLMPVDHNQEVVIEEEVDTGFGESEEEGFEVTEGGDFSVGSSTEEKSILKNPEKRKKVMIGAVLVLLLWSMLGGDEEKEGATSGKDGDKKGEAAGKKGAVQPGVVQEQVRVLSPEEKEYVASHYRLGKAYALKGDYARSLEELELVREIDPAYESTESLYLQAKEGLAELERLEKERKEKEKRAKIRVQVKVLIKEAKEAFKQDKFKLVDAKIGKILEIDPENVDVQELKMEVEAVKEDKARKKAEIEEKKRVRQGMVDALGPGKNFYLKEEWFKAIIKLQQFLDKKRMDEDLIKEATRMLNQSKERLNSVVDPLLGKARALREGQDLKGAYEAYTEVLEVDPSNEESLNQMASIRDDLDNRAKKIYREAIISESLSLFNEAKEKFQEVQQVSPSDSMYYKKATLKLKEYID